MEVDLITIPVYRLNPDTYYHQRETFIEKKMFQGTEEYINQTKEYYKKYPEQEIIFREHLERRYGGAWDFNEIIGFIKLYFSGSQILGKYWEVSVKRIVKSRKKQFQYVTYKLAPELDIPLNPTDQQIFEIICEYLTLCKNELKKRYVDDRELLSIGPFLHWSKLYRKSI